METEEKENQPEEGIGRVINEWMRNIQSIITHVIEDDIINPLLFYVNVKKNRISKEVYTDLIMSVWSNAEFLK